MAALIFDHVTKRFGTVTAVDRLSFAVAPGEVFGFLGGNGAGKTSSLRMVLDIIRPDEGAITLLDRSPAQADKLALGFLPEERGLYRTMGALETVAYFGRLKGMTLRDARAAGRTLLERFGLGDRLRQAVGTLSKGMAQKVQLATALVNSPRLLILDEPFSGLDPVNQALLEKEIRRIAAGGATVIFSTHVMQHAERLCDRLLLLGRGTKRFEGTQEEARARLPLRLTLTAQASPKGLPGVAHSEPIAGAEGWRDWRVTLQPGTAPADLLQAATAQGFPLRGFEVERPSLHDIFLHIVGAPEGQA